MDPSGLDTLRTEAGTKTKFTYGTVPPNEIFDRYKQAT